MVKVNRNNPCPCGSGKKYKHCCQKKGIDSNKLTHDEGMRSIPVRDKNINFVNRIGEALQLDSVEKETKTFQEFVSLLKKSVTPEAVKKIHLAIPDIWPDKNDLDRCFAQEKSNNSGLFIGTYLFDITTSLLNRHALYDETIILIDPFSDHRVIAPEFNPVIKPEEHITTTFHYILLWLQLLPWIEKGLIKVIRDPGDFDYSLRKTTLDISMARFTQNDELKKAWENRKEPEQFEESFKDQHTLSHSDEFFIDKLKDSGLSEDKIRDDLQRRRNESLYYVEVGSQSQLLKWTTGTNYEMGKYICEKTDSHIITDISYRWKEIEYDRKVNGMHIDAWTPFAKAFQGIQLQHLNGLSFNDLLKLRSDGYLEDMRAFLRRVWTACSTGEAFDKNNVENLSAELKDHINIANSEWKKIDSNLVKWFGRESFFGTVIGITSGAVHWIPAMAIAAAGLVNLVQSKMERNKFITRYPAAFLIESIRKKT